MLSANVIETRIANANSFGTDFRDTVYVPQLDRLLRFNIEGEVVKREYLRSKATKVWWEDDGSCYVRTANGYLHHYGDNVVMSLLSFGGKLAEKSVDDWIVCLESRLLSYQVCFREWRRRTGFSWSLFKPFGKSNDAQLLVRRNDGGGREAWICDGSRTVYTVGEKGVITRRFPNRIARLMNARGEVLAVGWHGKHVYAYGTDGANGGNKRYSEPLHFEVRNVECSKVGRVAAHNDHDLAVIDTDGSILDARHCQETIRALQLSECGAMLAILTESGTIHVLLVRSGAGIPPASVADVDYILRDGNDPGLEHNAMRKVVRRLDQWESNLRGEQSELDDQKFNVKRDYAFLRREEEDFARKKCGLERQERTHLQREADLRARRSNFRRRLRAIKAPEVLAARLGRCYQRSLGDAAEADRRSEEVQAMAAAIVETRTRLQAARAELASTTEESAGFQTQQEKLQAALALQNKNTEIVRRQRDELRSELLQRRAEYKRIETAIDQARSGVARLRGELAEEESILRETLSVKSELETARTRLQEHEEALRQVRAKLEEQRETTIKTEEELAQAQRAEKEVADRLRTLKSQTTKTTNRCEKLRAEATGAEEALSEAKKNKSELESQLAKLGLELEARKKSVEDLTGKRTKVSESRSRLQSTARRLETEVTALTNDVRNLKREEKKLSGALESASAEAAEMKRVVATREGNLGELEKLKAELRDDYEDVNVIKASLDRLAKDATAIAKMRTKTKELRDLIQKLPERGD